MPVARRAVAGRHGIPRVADTGGKPERLAIEQQGGRVAGRRGGRASADCHSAAEGDAATAAAAGVPAEPGADAARQSG